MKYTKRFVSLSIVIALSFEVPTAFAAPRHPINRWFCSVLKAPFEPAAAINSFPLEKLPEGSESRETKGEGDDKNTWVEFESVGDKYEVNYRYAFNEADVTDRYGFSLSVRPVDFDADDFAASSWLREFGKAEETILGSMVPIKKSKYGVQPDFYFDAWRSPGARYGANWGSSSDLSSAAGACK
ncbi:hypothetical protein [Novosphingobium sp. BL-52-GroH]|uniref:hypothetical protein n=1 Tax=Novosphingobium sp. BL-52-GroH TaxID=3349877 RepID=UPI00384EC226